MTKYKLARDIDDDTNEGEYLLAYKRSLEIKNLSISLDENIREPKYYRAVIEEINNLGEHDTCTFRLNNTGGRLDGLISLLNAVDNTKADVLAVIEGDCHSAASIFALNCPNVFVSPYASMMVHHVSYGAAGKDSDVVGQVLHNTAYCKQLFINTYKYFLTDKEIEDVINGKEIWMHAPEIESRLKRKAAALAKSNKPKKIKDNS